ncbi:MAG: helix-turn-helix domain-containing protein [Tissierellia bacterium]|nr:helix-turn-helix domain-containing protein [Tissierellia bacterium]
MKNQFMELRASLNLSQYELSQKVGVSRTSISKIETGKSISSVVLAHKIADVLGYVYIKYLM